MVDLAGSSRHGDFKEVASGCGRGSDKIDNDGRQGEDRGRRFRRICGE